MKNNIKSFNRTIIIILIICTGLSCSRQVNDPGPNMNNHRIWYTYPAKYWNSQALHLGNGYFGASFYGGVEEEVFSLTDASMWTGGPANGDWVSAGVNPNAKEAIPLIREAVINGKIHEADSMIARNVFGSSDKYGNFTSIGDLKIGFLNQNAAPINYHRELNLSNSTGKIEYDKNGTSYKREYFCSYPDRVLAVRFSSTREANISVNIFTEGILQDSSFVEIDDNIYTLKGFINGNNRPFVVMINVKNEGGNIGQEGEALTVRGANSVELFLTIATNYKMKYPDYVGEDPDIVCRKILEQIKAQSFDQLKKKHSSDYKELYDRVSLELAGNKEAEILPTNERYKRYKSGESDPGYKELAFNLGRYMIISSSRPNTLPSNLQGVWNVFPWAPWAGNYQSNVNLQEIYWSCGPTDLLECHQSYIDWIDDLAKSGREVAQRVYGTDGWISHTTGNIWGHAAPWGNHPWGMYSMGSAWHCQHVWDHFAFTQDMDYLKIQAYPLLKDASVFWLENVFPYEGYLITAPTVSAEHGALMTDEGLNPAFHDFRSRKYVYSLPGVYQDMEMLWDLFSNTSKAAKLMGEDAFAKKLLATRDQLLPLKIGKYGQLQEWYWDIDDPECHHRHIAHLYAVAPGFQIHPTTTPELAVAAKKALDMRGDGRFMEQESASGGNWARAHRMWSWTRLMDGNRANKIMTEMLTEEGFENVLTFQHAGFSPNPERCEMEGDLHLHYQLDGSASLPGCITEMLLQSHMGEIHLLPALPDELNTGKISGIKARGGFTIDMEWKDGELAWANITAPEGKEVPDIRLKEDIIDIEEYNKINIIK
ncbi:glycoside hydrolase N-terminal domain-containing protein [Bacteroidota bacterium]